MSFYIYASTYEVKANLSRFIRALLRGAADYVVVQRYGRDVAYFIPFKRVKAPALPPETKDDIAMHRRACYIDDGRPSRR